MHDGMPYGLIQGQGQYHMALKVWSSSIFKIYLLRHCQWELANHCWYLNLFGPDFFISVLFLCHVTLNLDENWDVTFQSGLQEESTVSESPSSPCPWSADKCQNMWFETGGNSSLISNPSLFRVRKSLMCFCQQQQQQYGVACSRFFLRFILVVAWESSSLRYRHQKSLIPTTYSAFVRSFVRHTVGGATGKSGIKPRREINQIRAGPRLRVRLRTREEWPSCDSSWRFLVTVHLDWLIVMRGITIRPDFPGHVTCTGVRAFFFSKKWALVRIFFTLQPVSKYLKVEDWHFQECKLTPTLPFDLLTSNTDTIRIQEPGSESLFGSPPKSKLLHGPRPTHATISSKSVLNVLDKIRLRPLNGK